MNQRKNSRDDVRAVARRLAQGGIETVGFAAISYITTLGAQIQTINAPEIAMLRILYGALLARWKQVLRQEAAQARRYYQAAAGGFGRWNLTVAGGATVGGFCVAVKSIQDFDLGWLGPVWCAGLCVGVAYGLAWLLREFPSRHVERALGLAAVTLLLTVSFMFGKVRGDVLSRTMNEHPTVILDNLGAPATPDPDQEAEKILGDFGLVWALSALGLELVGGVALHRYWESRRALGFDELRNLQKEAKRIEEEMRAVLARLNELLSEPSRVAREFWAEFDRGESEARRQMEAARRVAMWIGLAVLAAGSAEARDRVHIVAMPDLSLTQLKGVAGVSEFTANMRLILSIITSLDTGTRITVAGITSSTFTSPHLLLDARTPEDAGPFNLKLNKARREILSEWTRRTQGILPTYKGTDVVGAFQFAGAVFERSEARRKVLLLLSDTRNFTRDLDLEKPARLDVAASLSRIEKLGIRADLRTVEAYVLGAGDRSDVRGAAYFNDLQRFYTTMIARWGGRLVVFSPTRPPEMLSLIAGQTEN